MEGIFRIQRDITPVGPEFVGWIGGFPIANTFLLSLVVILVIALFAFFYVRKFKIHPTEGQNIVETVYEQMIDLVQQITGSRTLAENIFPLIGALLVYIGVANLIGLIPGLTSFTFGEEGIPIFRTPTSDFNTTFGLAFAMIILIQIASIRDYGIFGYIGRFIKVKEVIEGFKKGLKAGIMAIIEFLIGLLDIVSEIAKVISLSFRLFGNLFAGEVLAVLILGAFAFFLPALWLSLNILFAFVQAIVFGALVAAYYTLSVQTEEEKEQRREELES